MVIELEERLCNRRNTERKIQMVGDSQKCWKPLSTPTNA